MPRTVTAQQLIKTRLRQKHRLKLVEKRPDGTVRSAGEVAARRMLKKARRALSEKRRMFKLRQQSVRFGGRLRGLTAAGVQ